ncbi:MAG: zf-TFIIB domain-containing protein [Desulfobacterales bacterium]|nr:zf-TFIIB domain-containing protein [Desulfobacterales bacterium]
MAINEALDKEDEYFLKLNAKKVSELRGNLDQKRREDEKQMRKQAHWMKCPKCGGELQEVNYQSVLIDTCVDCRGVWLDHGELDLLARGNAKLTRQLIAKIFG